MSVDPSELKATLARVDQWLAMDPDPVTRRELQALRVRRDMSPLLARFSGELHFGTAGLRGVIGGGPTCMNMVTVAQAAAGLARQLMADVPDAARRGVVVARDGRRKSPEFAKLTAEVLAGYGLRVLWFEAPTPTPVAAFACRHLSAAAAVVITASHNPPAYNGFKVFSERASQIVPPQDERIRQERAQVDDVRKIPRRPWEDAIEAELIVALTDDIGEAYHSALASQCLGELPPPAPLRVVTTSLHGVGHRWLHEALSRRGFDDLHAVTEQSLPDGAFPTVAFPNPEEPGALDLALELARKKNADMVIANDPDADRLCVAVSTGQEAGTFRVLTGNELGILLADWLMMRHSQRGSLPKSPVVLASVVSTRMLASVAAAYGARCEFTLTGFKWIWDRALLLEDQAEFMFAFEEALGYCVGPVVRDKDGIGAAQAIAELASFLRADDKTLAHRVDELAMTHGLHATRQVSILFADEHGRDGRGQVMDSLRASPPREMGGRRVERSFDFLDGAYAREQGVPTTNMLVWQLDGGGQVIARPSGTEPKLKFYLEVVVDVADRKALPEARQRADALLDGLASWVHAAADSAKDAPAVSEAAEATRSGQPAQASADTSSAPPSPAPSKTKSAAPAQVPAEAVTGKAEKSSERAAAPVKSTKTGKKAKALKSAKPKKSKKS